MEAARLWVIFVGIVLPGWSFVASGAKSEASDASTPSINDLARKIKDFSHSLEQFKDPTRDSNSNYSKVSCDFSQNACGWENVGGENYSLQWERKRDSYMHLNMDDAGEHLKGRLASPWLPQMTNYRCQLRFQYYIRNSKKCQLSLIRQTAMGDEQEVWVPQKNTVWYDFSKPVYQDINCTAESYRLVFEGWKTCDVWPYDEIDIMAIYFIVHPEDMEPATDLNPQPIKFTIEPYTGTTPAGITTPAGTASSTDKRGTEDNQRKDKADGDSESGLKVEFLAGIIVAVVVVIGIVVFIIIVVVRRRCRRDKSDNDLPNQEEPGTVNLAHALETEGRGNDVRINNPSHSASPSDDTYDHTMTSTPRPPASGDTYDHTMTSTPRPPASGDTYDHTMTSTPRPPASGDTYDHTMTSTSRPPASGDTYDHTMTSTPRPPASDDTYDHTSGAPFPRASTSEDTYHHANAASPQHHPNPDHVTDIPKQRCRPNVQNLTTSSKDAAGISVHERNTDYENIDDVDKGIRSPPGGGDDVYNRLDASGEMRRGEGVVGENVYDHAKDDNYANVHQEGRRSEEQKHLAEDDYSHV